MTEVEEHWKQIAGIHTLDNGALSVVWLALDPDNDVIHLTDACNFKREVLPVIAEGINNRGRRIPIAWVDYGFKEMLLERGCNMLPEPCDDNDQMAEMVTREIWLRMRTHRFKVNRHLAEWLDEYKTFNRENNAVPRDSHPLMAATRHAIQSLPWARAQRSFKDQVRTKPRLAIV